MFFGVLNTNVVFQINKKILFEEFFRDDLRDLDTNQELSSVTD